jgi:hypothetical protein
MGCPTQTLAPAGLHDMQRGQSPTILGPYTGDELSVGPACRMAKEMLI